MAENTNIQWCDHTFNPWSGCTKVSPACDHCYAEVNYSVKMRGVKWGKYGNRIIASDSMWKQPLKWNREAERAFADWEKHSYGGSPAPQRPRVFCASLADVFEGPGSMPPEAWEPVSEARARLFDLIFRTPNLIWLLLTKRPENVLPWLDGLRLPDNVWIGTTVENQKYADLRIPELLKIPAKVRFLSIEPLLGPIDLSAVPLDYPRYPSDPDVNWVIVGGESGPKSRPFDIAWARSIIQQCNEAAVPCFVKQLGAKPCQSPERDGATGFFLPLNDKKGGEMSEWPEDLRVRQFPNLKAEAV